MNTIVNIIDDKKVRIEIDLFFIFFCKNRIKYTVEEMLVNLKIEK